MAAKDDLGRYGEDLAAAFLRGQGMTLIERNWRCDRGELDIIAGDGDCLVVCEVKTRSSQAYGTPLEAVSGRKLARLRMLTRRWMQERSVHAPRVRIDAIGILMNEGPPRITHLRGIG